jgi:hypothetical protein
VTHTGNVEAGMQTLDQNGVCTGSTTSTETKKNGTGAPEHIPLNFCGQKISFWREEVFACESHTSTWAVFPVVGAEYDLVEAVRNFFWKLFGKGGHRRVWNPPSAIQTMIDSISCIDRSEPFSDDLVMYASGTVIGVAFIPSTITRP